MKKLILFIKISKEDFPSIKIVRITKALDIKTGEYFGPILMELGDLKLFL